MPGGCLPAHQWDLTQLFPFCMRTILLALALLPLAGWAQKPVSVYEFQPGSYVLNDAPEVRHPTTLKQLTYGVIVIQGENGKKTKLDYNQIKSFRAGQQQFVVAHGMLVKGKRQRLEGFAQQIDSGQVMLCKTEFTRPNRDGPADTYPVLLLKYPQDPYYVPMLRDRIGDKGFQGCSTALFSNSPRPTGTVRKPRIHYRRPAPSYPCAQYGPATRVAACPLTKYPVPCRHGTNSTPVQGHQTKVTGC